MTVLLHYPRSLFQEKRKAVALDCRYGGAAFDLLESAGFVHAVYQACRLKPAASGLLAAPVCSSWVFVSRHSTGRTAANPEGNPSSPSVQAGNLLTARTLVILWIAFALQAWFIVEQPKGSLMELHPCFQAFLARVRMFRYYMRMSEYGSPTEKPTWLYSSIPAKNCFKVTKIFWLAFV